MGFNRKLVFTGCYTVSSCPMLSCFLNNKAIVAPLLSIGLFGFAWTSLGPPQVHWIAPMIFSALIAIANVRQNATTFCFRFLTDYICVSKYAIYMATVDYMIAAYGPYAASATGGNGFARDFLAGIAAMYSIPSKYTGNSNRISTNSVQCISIWAQYTDWNGHRHYWASWPLFSPFRSTFSTGKDPGSENCHHLRRHWLPTGKQLVAESRLVVRAIQTLSNDICHRDLTCRTDVPLILVMGEVRL